MSTRWVQVPKRRRTKLVASLHPGCDEAAAGRFIAAGLNLVRLDVRAVDRDQVQQIYGALRAAAHNARNPIGVIADLGDVALDDGRTDDITFLSQLGVDYFMVGSAGATAAELRGALPEGGTKTVLATISGAAALTDAEGLMEAADGLVITTAAPRNGAAGDLAAEDLPVVQRHLLALARARGKPCIVTTASLTSGGTGAGATSAEVSDVATAVLAGADAVLLGAEPTVDATVRALEVADAVARRLEGDLAAEAHDTSAICSSEHGLVRAAVQLARDIDAGAIVVQPSERSGLMSRALSAMRPSAPVVGLALSLPAMLQQSMLWGVVPRWVRPDELGDADGLARTVATQLDLAGPGGCIVVIEGGDASDPSAPARVSVLSI